MHPERRRQQLDGAQREGGVVGGRSARGAQQDEAVGGQGVPLMPGRSIAIDRALHAYGTPFFITADLPIATIDEFRNADVASKNLMGLWGKVEGTGVWAEAWVKK